ncbi:hypothetical protein E3J38_05450 [candidate division TA06 bacterium]|uniref:DUF5678 domain-containing protein n=1 Tax=candidate division TA06 bacterium TaxID=2250710 RepID=A0A523XMR6_UNCT6|nr:MAG: hypothetical protein E3J38_05450 [candidate division TA06 bacterium]
MAQVPRSSFRPKASDTRMLAKTLEDSRWVVKEWDRLKDKYANSFVAVLDCKVIAHHKNMERLMEIVDKKFPHRKDFVTTEFISLKDVRWIR